jgi:purine nucleoside phosphorylase
MSTAPEVRAALALGLPVCALSLVVNRSGASLAHTEVVAAGERLAGGLAAGLGPLVEAFLDVSSGPARVPPRPPHGDRRTGP